MADLPEKPSVAARLRGLTQARVALGRVGEALPTAPMLDFQLAHARARDAVHAGLTSDGFAEAIGRSVIEVRSQAADRAAYLRRPDLGRLLDPESAIQLGAFSGESRSPAPPSGWAPAFAGEQEVAFIVGDGLSATAVHAHAASLLLALFDRLPDWRIAPIVLARQARVALGDEIGAALGVPLVVVLIGERPGLSAPDSLGVYLTWEPRRGRLDSERNCVSSIRPPHGLGYAEAAERIVWLMYEARARRLTGIDLKEASGALPGVTPAAGTLS